MDEKNPLQVSSLPTDDSNDQIINKSGRPNMKNMVKFSPQPKSIIAKMLSEIKTKTSSSNKDDDDIIICQSDQTCDIVETDKTEEHVCQTCSHRSDSLKEHRKHVSTHQQFSCNYPNCSYSCKLSSNLIKHKRVHTNEKPYLCDRCSFRSNFVNSLKAHRRIHTAEKPYQCEHCSYRCNSSSNLKKHCNLRHSKTPNGNYK